MLGPMTNSLSLFTAALPVCFLCLRLSLIEKLDPSVVTRPVVLGLVLTWCLKVPTLLLILTLLSRGVLLVMWTNAMFVSALLVVNVLPVNAAGSRQRSMKHWETSCDTLVLIPLILRG